MHLRNARSFYLAKRCTPKSGKFVQSPAFRLFPSRNSLSPLGQITIVLRQDLAALIFLNVAACDDPIPTQCGQTFAHIAFRRLVGPYAAGVINTNWRIFLERPIEVLRRRQRDLAERNS